MTDTTTILTTQQPEAVPHIPTDPSDILMDFIVAVLAPMFLGASTCDIGFARLAAIETVNAYRARNHADLVSIAQIVGFGLTALGSLSLSMADNISLSMTLRLRGNAVSLNRAAEHNRRALEKSRAGNTMSHPAPPWAKPEAAPEPSPVAAPKEIEDLDPAALANDIATVRQLAADTQAHLHAPQPDPGPTPTPTAPTAAPAPAPTPAAQSPTPPASATAPMLATASLRNQAAWAAAMADVAAELTSGIANLPPLERRAAPLRAAALTTTANSLLSEINTPPSGPATFGNAPLQGRSPIQS